MNSGSNGRIFQISGSGEAADLMNSSFIKPLSGEGRGAGWIFAGSKEDSDRVSGGEKGGTCDVRTSGRRGDGRGAGTGDRKSVV